MLHAPDVQTPRIPINPPVYYAPKAIGSLVLDGNLEKDFWKDVPFTSPFVDISGPDFPTPRFLTRAKICWDEENLYIGARLDGDEIWANITKRDSVMYYDNDFEVFIDSSSSTHNYMELEMNALNTQWDLMLTHPYRDGGRSVTGWDMKGLQTAVYVSGEVNNPSADNRFWSVEIKIPFSSLMETYSREENPPDLERCYPCRQAPKTGEFWRMNFSRVQWTVEKKSAYKKVTDENGKWRPEDNWVWAPTGLIDIHCPEFWGYVFFTENGENFPILQDEKRKLDLRLIYYAQYVYRRRTGSFTSDLRALGCPLPVYPVTCEATSRTFLLSCDSEEKGCRVYLRDDGYTFTEAL